MGAALAARSSIRLQAEAPDVVDPVVIWSPSHAPLGLRSSPGAFPQWDGDFFIGGLIGQSIIRVRVADGRRYSKAFANPDAQRPGTVRGVSYFLANPQEPYPGTSMANSPILDSQVRMDIAAFLATTKTEAGAARRPR